VKRTLFRPDEKLRERSCYNVSEYAACAAERYAYRIIVNDDGDLEWHCIIDNQKVVETKEPLTSGWLRFKAWFSKIAPESQL
jgi:hypothetical protein